jgi:hypothetical protein
MMTYNSGKVCFKLALRGTSINILALIISNRNIDCENIASLNGIGVSLLLSVPHLTVNEHNNKKLY